MILTLIALYAKLRSDVIASGEIWLPEEGNLQLTPGATLRVEVLGYALNTKPIKVRSVAATRIVKAKLDPGAALVVGPVTGVAGLPGGA